MFSFLPNNLYLSFSNSDYTIHSYFLFCSWFLFASFEILCFWFLCFVTMSFQCLHVYWDFTQLINLFLPFWSLGKLQLYLTRVSWWNTMTFLHICRRFLGGGWGAGQDKCSSFMILRFSISLSSKSVLKICFYFLRPYFYSSSHHIFEPPLTFAPSLSVLHLLDSPTNGLPSLLIISALQQSLGFYFHEWALPKLSSNPLTFIHLFPILALVLTSSH